MCVGFPLTRSRSSRKHCNLCAIFAGRPRCTQHNFNDIWCTSWSLSVWQCATAPLLLYSTNKIIVECDGDLYRIHRTHVTVKYGCAKQFQALPMQVGQQRLCVAHQHHQVVQHTCQWGTRMGSVLSMRQMF